MKNPFISVVATGAAGAAANFLAGLGKGHYQHGGYVAKFSIEVAGGALTATLVALSVPFINPQIGLLVAFVIGSAWSNVIQVVRTRVTELVSEILDAADEDAEDEPRGGHDR